MAITDKEQGSTDERRSDTENLDLIAAYVRDQRKAEKSWTQEFGKFTIYLALAAFFFGVGTFSDLRDRIAPPPLSVEQVAKNRYITSLDGYCRNFTLVAPGDGTGTGYDRIVSDDTKLLTVRNQLGEAWTKYAVPGNMDPRDVGAMGSIRSYYFAANNFLQAAIARAAAGDRDGYVLHVGLYRQANGDFLAAASDFGFKYCNHYWPVVDVP